MPPIIIKPVDVAKQLGVSQSTLRRWSNEFGEHLSAEASPDDAGTRRRFRPSDVTVLQRAKGLLDAGNNIEQVNDILALDDFSTAEADQAQEPPTGDQQAPTALVSLLGAQLAGTQQDQAQRINAQDARLTAVEAQLADLRVQVARLEALVDALSRQQISQADQVASIGSKMHRHPGIVPTRR